MFVFLHIFSAVFCIFHTMQTVYAHLYREFFAENRARFFNKVTTCSGWFADILVYFYA